jgi:hypothetical protein
MLSRRADLLANMNREIRKKILLQVLAKIHKPALIFDRTL